MIIPFVSHRYSLRIKFEIRQNIRWKFERLDRKVFYRLLISWASLWFNSYSSRFAKYISRYPWTKIWWRLECVFKSINTVLNKNVLGRFQWVQLLWRFESFHDRFLWPWILLYKSLIKKLISYLLVRKFLNKLLIHELNDSWIHFDNFINILNVSI